MKMEMRTMMRMMKKRKRRTFKFGLLSEWEEEEEDNIFNPA